VEREQSEDEDESAKGEKEGVPGPRYGNAAHQPVSQTTAGESEDGGRAGGVEKEACGWTTQKTRSQRQPSAPTKWKKRKAEKRASSHYADQRRRCREPSED